MVTEGGVGVPFAGAWMVLSEDLLAGIVHSMNNAVTVVGLSLQLGSPDASGDLIALHPEVAHLQDLIALTSTLSVRSPREEALEIRAVVDVALMLLAQKRGSQSIRYVLQVTGELPPVRVHQSSLLRVLLLLIDGARRANPPGMETVPIDISGNNDSVTIRVATNEPASGDVLALAVACGGTLIARDGSQWFELPSLQRLRATSAATARHDTVTPTRATGS